MKKLSLVMNERGLIQVESNLLNREEYDDRFKKLRINRLL